MYVVVICNVIHTQVDVVSDDQREKMKAMTLDKDRAGYLLDHVIIPTLKVDIQEPFYNFLEVLEQDENVVVKKVAKDLRSLLGPPMPQPGQPFPGQPQYGGQPYPGQPQYGGQPYPAPPQVYPGQPYAYPGQP